MEIVNPSQLKKYHSAQSEISSPHLTKPFFSLLNKSSTEPFTHPKTSQNGISQIHLGTQSNSQNMPSINITPRFSRDPTLP
jgi:hypothetical protein